MSKMKTRKSASKRYSFTSKGKVKYKKQDLRHILTKKSSKRKRHLGKAGVLSSSEVKRIRTLLPYA
ncbi:50S ribosomal protein L35 [Borrelia sp. BU AG58]|uniref:50S ribosomal protein L35 n=1 Tax=Borrelia sp. BU AG58 TaxID=2887345 RepID=UPI001E467EE7|nr:50S ribosomal protein L35 [Borrelia sp. BU AG58]UER67384.1 50S ribosomal protein L35 [Borrelia sp. BU AG58]